MQRFILTVLGALIFVLPGGIVFTKTVWGNDSVTITVNYQQRDSKRWTFERDTCTNGEVTLELVNPLLPGEAADWATFSRRAKEIGANLGLCYAEALRQAQSRIPPTWRAYDIFFPGTEMADASGEKRVPYLSWRNGRGEEGPWRLDYDWVEKFPLEQNERVLRLRK